METKTVEIQGRRSAGIIEIIASYGPALRVYRSVSHKIEVGW
jgi:hypothetical protein